VIACNGTFHHISLAEWLNRPVTGNGIDPTNGHGAHLVATVTAEAITGTVTLKDGTSAPALAPARTGQAGTSGVRSP
jgi:hypothetical protein